MHYLRVGMSVSLMMCMRYLSWDVCQFDGVHALPQRWDVCQFDGVHAIKEGLPNLFIHPDPFLQGKKQKFTHTSAVFFTVCFGQPKCKRYQDKNFKIMFFCLFVFVFVCVCACMCVCLLYTSPSPRDKPRSRMPSSA